METLTLKQKLESVPCHIHGDAAHITVIENEMVEIETCCLLLRHQLLLMAGENESRVKEAV